MENDEPPHRPSDSPSLDEHLRDIANAISRTRFTDPLTETELQACQLAESGTTPRFNIYRLGTRWLVKFYRGGKQQLWAAYSADRFTDACRLADMLRYKYGSMRVRHPIPRTDEFLNIGPNRAKRDCENEHEIVSLIMQFELALPEVVRKPRKTGTTNNTQWARSEKAFGVITNRITDVETNMGEAFVELDNKIQALHTKLDVALKHLGRLLDKEVECAKTNCDFSKLSGVISAAPVVTSSAN